MSELVLAELVVPGRRAPNSRRSLRSLDQIAESIRSNHSRGAMALRGAVDAYFAIGHDLEEARAQLPSDNAFGSWLKQQEFGFSPRWAWTLRQAAELEGEVRSQLPTGQPVNIEKAVQRVRRELGLAELASKDTPVLPEGRYRTLVADPPWRYASPGVTKADSRKFYPTLSVDEIASLEVTCSAEEDAHLWLWATNALMEEAHRVVREWGFSPLTIVTWCKPSPGVGHYLRNNTEHVILASRGQPMTPADKPLSTWYLWPRGRHSQKPQEFYALVEQVSPEPYLELFARQARENWSCWGNEVAPA